MSLTVYLSDEIHTGCHDQIKQSNAHFCVALGKPNITEHKVNTIHLLKEVLVAAMAWAQNSSHIRLRNKQVIPYKTLLLKTSEI